MDLIENLAKQASQITMYDVKSYYNQAKNMVLSVSEMEAKVREATNDDPWGASSTLMKEIAEGTQNFQQFNEIMPTIYSRFMEKEAREWRQIYKALTLLEFLVKNGSERVVDDARAHVSTIKMLRSFHYIDEKGKDQGINVRNRASEIASLLGDVERIRQERRKAKSNRTKYGGQGNDGGMSFVTTSGSRYGGFGSETLGGGGGGEGGSRGGSGGYDAGDDYRPSRSFADKRDEAEYDEYEGADDFDNEAPSPRRTGSSSTPARSSSKPQPPPKNTPKPVEKAQPPVKEVNLFDFDDDEPVATAAPAAPSLMSGGGDDDFDDFQSAPIATTPSTKPTSSSNNAGLFDLLNSTSTSTTTPSQQVQPKPPILSAPVQAATPLYSTSSFAQPLTAAKQPSMTSRPSYTSPPPSQAPAPKKAASSGFDDLWNTSMSGLGSVSIKPSGTEVGKKSMADMEREKAQSGLWGGGTGSGSGSRGGGGQKQGGSGGGGGGFDDLLF